MTCVAMVSLSLRLLHVNDKDFKKEVDSECDNQKQNGSVDAQSAELLSEPVVISLVSKCHMLDGFYTLLDIKVPSRTIKGS